MSKPEDKDGKVEDEMVAASEDGNDEVFCASFWL
jgi:hypothetical protein